MNLLLSKLSGVMPSYTWTGWATSAVVHAAGALAVWATCAAMVSPKRPALLGNTTRVELTARWTSLQPPSPPIRIAPLQPPVLVTPELARIAERTYSHRSSDVSQPTTAELAMVERLLSAPAASPRRSTVSTAEEAAAERSTVSPLRPAKVPAVPTVKAEYSTSARRPRPVGTRDETLPRLLDNRPPTYPQQAIARRLQGTVRLRLQITAEGRVGNLEVDVSSGHPILDAAAVRTVRTWRFAPARRHGEPVATTVRLPVRFALD